MLEPRSGTVLGMTQDRLIEVLRPRQSGSGSRDGGAWCRKPCCSLGRLYLGGNWGKFVGCDSSRCGEGILRAG